MCVPFLNIHGFLFVFCKKKGREKIMQVYATFWALLPPIIAIVLALITKEVYSSLFIGIVVGALFYSGSPLKVPSTTSSSRTSMMPPTV